MPKINFQDSLLERGKQVLTEAIEAVAVTSLGTDASPSGKLTVVDTASESKALKLELFLPKGDKGDPGPAGPAGPKGKDFSYNDFTPTQLENLKIKGDKGENGEDGYSPQIAVDPEIEILSPESSAYVEDLNSDLHDALLKFHIPRGTRGEQGRGAQITVSQVRTLEPGSEVTCSETVYYNKDQNANITALTLGIPKGDTGTVQHANLITVIDIIK